MDQTSRTLEVWKNCYDIIEEIHSANHYVTYELVVQVLLDRYSIHNFQQLGLTHPNQIPILKQLFQLQSTINNYLSVYLSSSYGSVHSLHDLEIDLIAYLFTSNCEPLSKFKPPNILNPIFLYQDPNAINIDDIEGDAVLHNESAKYKYLLPVKSFDYFGLGSSMSHPLIVSHFNLHLLSARRSHFVTTSAILMHFVGYVSKKHLKFVSDFKVTDFEVYLLEVYDVNELSCVGVKVVGDFFREYSSLLHIINKERKRIIDFQNQQLSKWNQIASNESELQQTSSCSLQKPLVSKSGNKSHKVKLKESSRPHIAKFLEDFRQAVNRVRSDNPHSLSFNKIHTILMTEFIDNSFPGVNPISSIQGCNKIDNFQQECPIPKVKRRRKFSHCSTAKSNEDELAEFSNTLKSPGNIGKIVPMKTLVEVVADYLSLYFGSTTYLSKRIIPVDVPMTGGYTDNLSAAGNMTVIEAGTHIGVHYDTSSDDATLTKIIFDSDTKVNLKPDAASSTNSNTESKQTAYTTLLRHGIELPCSAIPEVRVKNAYEGKIHTDNKEAFANFSTQSILELLDGVRIFTIESKDLKKTASLLQQSSDSTSLLSGLPNPVSMSNCNSSIDLRWVGRLGESLVYQYLLLHLDIADHNSNIGGASSSTQADINRSGRCVNSINPHRNTTQGGIGTIKSVEWVNEIVETTAAYDIVLTAAMPDGNQKRHYIEVKSTRFADNNVFEISMQEWDFATGNPRVQYSVFRVLNVCDPDNVRLVIIPDLLQFATDKKVKLCIAI